MELEAVAPYRSTEPMSERRKKKEFTNEERYRLQEITRISTTGLRHLTSEEMRFCAGLMDRNEKLYSEIHQAVREEERKKLREMFSGERR
jgi:hypothetical protein